MPLSKDDIAKRFEDIKAIYKDFLVKLFPLRKEQDEIIQSYVQGLEEEKLERIRKRISSKKIGR